MKLLHRIEHLNVLKAGSVATIGNFDGVHLGHQALIKRLCSVAKQRQLPSLVILFEPQPSEYFHGNEAPARLTTLREKVQILSELGVDYVHCLHFNKKLAVMPAEAFAEQIIFSGCQVTYLIVGADFRFGAKRQGDVGLLIQLGKLYGCEVESQTDYCLDDERISSTGVRQALAQGLFHKAETMLGRPYSLSGRVVRGAGKGREWGVPTANLHIRRLTLPLSGVYCIRVKRLGRPDAFGVANCGCRPTVDGSKNVLEVHLFDTNESLYGDWLQVFFLHKLRNEFKFASLDALIAQIHLDVAAAKQYCEQLSQD